VSEAGNIDIETRTKGRNSGFDSEAPPVLFVVRLAWLSAGWFVLSGGDGQSFIVGGPTIIAATWLSLRLARPRRLRWRLKGLLRFIPFFLGKAFVGGLDVARRVFAPGLPIAPALVPYSVGLNPGGPSAVFFANVISLLPGTLCARIDGRKLLIHVIDANTAYLAQLEELEEIIGELFGEERPIRSGNAVEGG
jgi:multicomponent Na+:H+ antiporter subunit E